MDLTLATVLIPPYRFNRRCVRVRPPGFVRDPVNILPGNHWSVSQDADSLPKYPALVGSFLHHPVGNQIAVRALQADVKGAELLSRSRVAIIQNPL